MKEREAAVDGLTDFEREFGMAILFGSLVNERTGKLLSGDVQALAKWVENWYATRQQTVGRDNDAREKVRKYIVERGGIGFDPDADPIEFLIGGHYQLGEDNRELRAEVEQLKAMLAETFEMVFKNGRTIKQPCSQPEGKQCWHDEDEHLYDSALEAFIANKEYERTT